MVTLAKMAERKAENKIWEKYLKVESLVMLYKY